MKKHGIFVYYYLFNIRLLLQVTILILNIYRVLPSDTPLKFLCNSFAFISLGREKMYIRKGNNTAKILRKKLSRNKDLLKVIINSKRIWLIFEKI